jgi:hypothetical protein
MGNPGELGRRFGSVAREQFTEKLAPLSVGSSHAARCVACHGVGSHSVPIAFGIRTRVQVSGCITPSAVFTRLTAHLLVHEAIAPFCAERAPANRTIQRSVRRGPPGLVLPTWANRSSPSADGPRLSLKG